MFEFLSAKLILLHRSLISTIVQILITVRSYFDSFFKIHFDPFEPLSVSPARSPPSPLASIQCLIHISDFLGHEGFFTFWDFGLDAQIKVFPIILGAVSNPFFSAINIVLYTLLLEINLRVFGKLVEHKIWMDVFVFVLFYPAACKLQSVYLWFNQSVMHKLAKSCSVLFKYALHYTRLFWTFFGNKNQVDLAKPWVFPKIPWVFLKIPWVYSKEWNFFSKIP